MSQEKPLIQRSAIGPISEIIPAVGHEMLGSPGALPNVSKRAFMESHVGHDFSQVAVHSESEAIRSELSPLQPIILKSHPFEGVHHKLPVQLQAKLAISQPEDEYEQEAERMARMVMRTPGPEVEGKELCSQKIHMAPSRGRIIFPLALQVPHFMQRRLRSSGQPLNDDVRAFMEPRFGYDFRTCASAHR